VAKETGVRLIFISALILIVSYLVMGDPHFIPAPIPGTVKKKESPDKKVSPQKQEVPMNQKKPINKKKETL
jgi:hypothetical protein